MSAPAVRTSKAARALRRQVEALLVAPSRAVEEPLAPAFAREQPAVRAWLEATLPAALEEDDSGGGAAVVADAQGFLARHFPGGGPWGRADLERSRDAAEVALRWRGEGALLLDAGPGGLGGLARPDLAGDLEAALERFVRRDLFDPTALTSPEAARALGARIEALGRLLRPLFAVLARVEAVRVAVATAPRAVIAWSWCAAASEVAEPARTALAADPAQRSAWEREHDVGGEAPLVARPTLPLDSRHGGPGARARLLEGLGDLQAAAGLLVRADNGPALRLVRRRLAGMVRCAYLDPPFNTASSAFAYRDRRPRAAWLCFMEERVEQVRALLTPDGTLYAHIDQHEKERLRLLLDRHLEYVAEVIWRIGWVSGFKTRARKFIRNHDTIYQYGRSAKPLFNKRYLPYPEGYVRRDGKPPTGKGIPLEDTWNCSAADRLDSIQIMSFSREKVGQGDLTQKNENLLERILLASTGPGDWVLDPFLGSGTTAATAHKLGRRWVGIEQGPAFEEVALPRMRRVLAGDRYGISAAHGWSGGGAFEVVELEDAAAVLARLLGQPVPAATEPVASLIHLGGLTLRRAWRCGDDLVVAAAVPDGSPRVVVGPGADRDELSAVVADARRWAQPSDPDRVPTFAFGAAFDALEGPELRSGDAALAALLAVERTVGVVDTMPA